MENVQVFKQVVNIASQIIELADSFDLLRVVPENVDTGFVFNWHLLKQILNPL